MSKLFNSKLVLLGILVLLTGVAWMGWGGKLPWQKRAVPAAPELPATKPVGTRRSGPAAAGPARPIDPRVNDAQRTVRADLSALERAERTVMASLALNPAYLAAINQKNDAIRRLRNIPADSPEHEQAVQDRMQATQTLTNLQNAALVQDKAVAEARARLQSSKQALEALKSAQTK